MYIFILFFLLLIKTNRFKLAKPQTPNQSRVSNKSTVCRKRLSLLRQRTCFLGVIHTSISLSASKLMPIRFCLNVFARRVSELTKLHIQILVFQATTTTTTTPMRLQEKLSNTRRVKRGQRSDYIF